MALSEAIDMLRVLRTPNLRCPYKILYDSLLPEDKKAIDNAWEKGYSLNIIMRALRNEGYKTSNESLSAHRRGTCPCPKL